MRLLGFVWNLENTREKIIEGKPREKNDGKKRINSSLFFPPLFGG